MSDERREKFEKSRITAIEGIRAYKVENELEDLPLEDMHDSWVGLMEGVNSSIAFDSVSQESYSYVFATYYIQEIMKSVVIDWEVETSFDSENDLVDYIAGLITEGKEVKELIANGLKKND